MRWIAFAAPLLMTAPLLAQHIVLDDFDTDPNDEAGGTREVSAAVGLNPYNQPSSFGVDTGFSFDSISGAAIFNSGIGVNQTGTINWDNNGAGLEFNAAGLGVVGFELDFLQVDQAFDVRINLETFGFNPNGTITAVSTIEASTAPFTAFVSLNDFVVPDGSGFTPFRVDAFTVIFNDRANPTTSLDFILTEFRAVVPSPATTGLLGLGGLIATRRRR